MSLEASNFETRIKSLTAVLGNAEHQKAVEAALQASEGDIRAALGSLETKLPPRTLEKVEFAHTLAEWSEDNIPVVKAIAKDPAVKNLRDVALSYDADSLVELVDAKAVPETTPGATPAEKKQNFAAALQDKLFAGEPSAVLQHMVETEQVPIADAGVRAGVAAFLTNQPDFNIRTTSIYTALKQPAALKGIAEEHVPQVVEQIKSLQRVQAFTPTARAVPVMLSANLTSAFRVAEMPESTFLKAHSAALGEDLARTIYTNAVNIHIRNEQALIAMREAVRGTGLAILDGDRSLDTRLKSLQRVTDDQDVPLNLESLFGSMDFCECEECTSVYSAAAYFVELLQFLRNNNLDPTKPNTGNTGIKDTPLEKLFRRRPDLGCLELTCENTDTILPYVDLVNEVMESFVVHLDKYKDEPPPKQSELEAFNVTDETSGELLAQPQHTDYEAYCILKSAVYPFTLPYHQPIDATRIFLKYLGTSRYELLDNFRTALDEASNALPAEQRDELAALHKTILDRAADAEYLGLTQEEYIILTKQAFWPLRYFELTKNQTCLEDEYLQKIGVKPVHEYYGYAAETGMLDADESKQMGLTFVKKQFLPRTGIQYIDLVDLLRTQCINPNFPQGKALTILESIQFSYRFLQTLVDTGSTDKKTRFAKLIEFLEQAQKYLPQLEEMLHPDACRQPTPDRQLESKDLRHWVYCDFEKVGKLIVLEAGEGPRLPIEGTLVYYASPDFATAGRLNADGSITNPEGRLIGSVTPEGKTVTTDGKSFVEQFNRTLWIKDDSGQTIGMIDNDELFYSEGRPFTWLPAQDTCDLDKVRLIHLDGTPLEVHEYDSMQRFIRLWRKTGWSIDETDKALAGLAAVSASAGLPVPSVASSHAVDFDAFADDCADPEAEDSEGCADTGTQSTGSCEITPGFLHQLVAVRKLLDLTGLPLTRLLTFWADISVAGKRSLYSSLFLTHNLLSIDKVFQADANGYYLTDSAKLSEHTPVLMTALKLKADDVTALTKFAGLADELTLPNISALYRNSLLAKALHVKVADLPQVTALFGDPFKSATDTLELFEAWGKMEDAGFTFRQLDYLVLDHDDALRPLAPAKRTVLSLGKTLFDGLNAIDRDHPDVPEDRKEQATTELVRAKTALLFDQAVIDQIVGLLEGTTLYTTNAPANQTITLTEALAKRLKYVTADATPPHAALQVTGILTEAEITQAKALSLHPEWSKAVDRIDKQKQNLYKDVLFGIFPDADDQTKNLLAGDVNLPDEQQDPNLPDPNTAPTKRFYFLKYFMPFLRRQLTHRFIVDTASGTAGLAKDVTDVLLSEILVAGAASQPAIDALEAVKTKPAGAAGGWKGYLIPSAEVAYTFVAIGDDQPAALLLNGESLPFKYQQEDPSDVWSTDPTPKLKRGSLYWLEVGDRPVEQLQWKTAASPKAAIPTSALLPDYTSQGTEEVLKKVGKAALLVNGFNLSAEEVSYWQTHAVDFGTFDFNSATFPAWKRLQAYIGLRNSLPKLEATLLDLFKWANKPADAAQLSEKIAAVTLWKKETVDKFLAAEHFDLNNPAAFVNEINLVKIQKALAVADKIGIDIDRLFEWAKPGSKFWDTHKIAEDIRNALRARFDEEQWEQAVKPLSDQLRENQKQALISYLLSQKELIDWEVVDADSLFEFFLIDVQMDPCMQTSRLKQAISSVQLFVQRCLLGLEEKHGVANDALDHERWDWMQRYRVWEANRKVFLYPENWIESNLRDDKSPFFKELEGELLQKDISKQNVEEALKTYLYKVDEVANMEVIGLHIEEGKRLHVFARTRNAPYFFYYRYLDLAEWNWYPWEKMQVDIPSYDVEDSSGKVTGNGCYLTPVVWNGRLLVFFPQFMKKTKPNANAGGKAFSDMAKDTPNSSKPTEYWEIKLAWSEYRNGKWTQKQVSKDAVWDIPAPVSAVPGTTFSSVSEAVHDAKDLAETADHQADTAKGAADTALGKAEDSRKASADATVSVPLDLVNPLRGPIAVINTVNDLHDKAVAAKNAVEDANSKAGDAKKATADAFGKAQDAVTAVENYEKAIAAAPPNPPGDISNYEFVPILSDADHLLGIRVFYDETIKGTFEFNGSHLTSQLTQTYSGNNQKEVNYFQHASSAVYSLQISTEVDKYRFDDSLPTTYTYSGTTPINFHHSDSHRLLGAINTEKLASFFRYYDDNLPPDKNDVFGGYDDDADPQTPNIYHELKRPYSIYNWELFFHTPAMLAQALTKSQHFEEALNWYHYIFNPLLGGASDPKLAWQFLPFREIDPTNVLEKLFLGLQPGQSNDAINEWRSKPFQPHVVARSRPAAYMKWVAVKYIETLIAWGDYLFRQDTIESINQATQLYVLAAHLYGPRGQKIPKRGKVQAQSYNSLLDKWDAFGNAMVEMELAFPFSNQTPFPSEVGNSNAAVGLANIFGFATTLYFCIPDNPQLREVGDTIDDRLFKIRHCENIEGVFRILPLFEPPIDPALLVQAAAQGLSLMSVLNDLNSPMPNYRFYYLLQKALELCSELKGLGNTFLSLKEKGDGEALSLLRARHESSIHNLVMEVKKQQLEEANKSLEALQQSRKGPVYRLQHFLGLIGEDLAKVPNDNTDFSELPNQIEQPLDESGLKLISLEKEEMDKSHAASDWQIGIGVTETLGGILNIIPVFAADVKPFGIGAGGSFGGSNLGSAASAVARGMQTYSNQLSFQSSNAGRKGGFLRQLQDRIQQANIAGYEIKNIDKQMLTQQIRINIANLEITNQQKQIDNAQEVEDFLRNKYTNQELYTWMQGQIRTLYYQAYTLAYELAKKAEKVFRFERGLSTSNFIQFGYWDAAYDGLLSGEKLYVGLKQLEAAYQENRGYDYEISKSISLRQINPMALLQLRELGSCEFDLPEVLFDMDRPGDYKRRIKSVSLTVPCVVGPYTSLNCTLRLLQNKFRLSSIAKDKGDYLEKTEEEDDRFTTVNVPITAIAVSTGQNDSGAFELNFRDERYLPFEGAGVISKWRLELPQGFHQFDYNTISDAILQIRYTSVEGGDKLKKIAADSVQDYINRVMDLGEQDGLFAVFDLVHDFPSEWYKAMNPPMASQERSMALNNLNDRLPVFTRGRAAAKIQATDLYLLTPDALSEASLSQPPATDETGFGGGAPVGAMRSLALNDIDNLPIANWQLNLTAADAQTKIETLWLIVRYKLLK